MGSPKSSAAPVATYARAPIPGVPIAGVEAFTNIGTTDLAADRGRFSPPPTARFLDRVNPDPPWITRWQNSATPEGDDRPWVKGFRWWEANVHFQSWGPVALYRIDFLWADHAHAYHDIPEGVWRQFRDWTGSVGQWFHDHILIPGWNGKTRRGARYPGFALSS